MSQSTAPSIRHQFDSRREQLRQQEGLPFLNLLSRPLVEAACRHWGHRWRKRIYTPWITLSIFLSQVLSDDHSCDDAVDRFQKARYDQGLSAVGTETGSYCEARRRLPEPVLWDLEEIKTAILVLRRGPQRVPSSASPEGEVIGDI